MSLSRKDARHYEIRAELRLVTRVQDVAMHEGLGCDMIAAHVVTGMPVFIEVKGERSRDRLTDSEKAMRVMFPGSYFVVVTVDEAFAAVGYVAVKSAAR